MRMLPFCLLATLAPVAGAQISGGQATSNAAVIGVVYDSVNNAPLSGAVVQLVAADTLSRTVRSTIADEQGRFTLVDLPDGRYLIGFLHPMLDSLGLEPPVREVYIRANRPVRLDLAIPSPSRVRDAICGGVFPDSGALLVGIVRDAFGAEPVAGAVVGAEWLELTFGAQGISRRVVRVTATTSDRGWFGLCNLPRDGALEVSARRAANDTQPVDNTDRLDVRMPAEGFLRRDLFVGSARTVVRNEATLPQDRGQPASNRRAGPGRLSGSVVAAANGAPVAGAVVGVTNGPETRTNAQGSWTLDGVPTGTRTLHVRAVGYYPTRKVVDVVPGAAPVRFELSTIKAVLDTVRVRAARPSVPEWSGFDARRRSSSTGRFLTPEDVARHPPIVTSNLFRMVPGLRIEGSTIKMRGVFEDECLPAVYLDGHYRGELTAEEIDEAVSPDEVAGIEVYAAAAAAPPQFQPGLKGCGSIVIWTRLRPAR